MSEYLREIYSNREELTDISKELQKISNCLFTVGNEMLADTLFELSDSIESCNNAIDDAVNKELSNNRAVATARLGGLMTDLLDISTRTS